MKQEAIRNLYNIFSKYKLNDKITGCHCLMCMDDAYDELLHKIPLNNLTTTQLLCYIQSASIIDKSCNDFKYFIPRILEIIYEDKNESESESESDYFIEFIWAVIAKANYHSWKHDEREAIDAFFKAYWNKVKNSGNMEIINWTVNDFKVIGFKNFELS